MRERAYGARPTGGRAHGRGSTYPPIPIIPVEDGWISAISDEMMVRKQMAMVMIMATAVCMVSILDLNFMVVSFS